MASTSKAAAQFTSTLPKPADSAASLEQLEEYLKAKDDTSRFVGLAILKSVLDNQPDIRNNTSQIVDLWNAISVKFLDRLLRASENQNVTKQETRDMTDIAVSVLHIFAILLPEETRTDVRFVGRVPALVGALLSSSPDTTTLVLQVLLTACSLPEGGSQLLKCKDLSSLIEIAPQQPLVLDVLSASMLTAASRSSSIATIRPILHSTLSSLAIGFRGTDSVTLLAFIGSLLPQLPKETLPSCETWLESIVISLRALITSRSTSSGRAAYTQAAAALLQAYTTEASARLFDDTATVRSDSKPFSYLFVNLLLIDIRSSFPSLLVRLNSTEYPLISKRLSAAFNVVSSFTGFLVQSLESEKLSMPPDLLLRLRKDIAETMSLTIEYLRDRWDASVAGVSGLHPEARSGTSATSSGTRLTLTWESIIDVVADDPLILASIRMLAIWLREDDNENLRKESAGLMDMLIELYRQSSQSRIDFRYPILLALEVIMSTEDGVDSFLAQSGWEIMSQDLLTLRCSQERESATRGIEIIRLLLAVIDSESTTSVREEWMSWVTVTCSMKLTDSTDSTVVEFQIAMLQLAVALLDLASSGMQKRYLTKISGLVGISNKLVEHVRHSLPTPVVSDFVESLHDVIMALENLR